MAVDEEHAGMKRKCRNPTENNMKMKNDKLRQPGIGVSMVKSEKVMDSKHMTERY